jgi:acyl carrier protein
MREESIRSALAAHGRLAVDVSTLSNDDDLYAAGLTSHATINVMLALEDDLEIEFPERLLRKATFGSISSIDDAVAEILQSVSS